jgi:hypothetical protein
MLTQLSRVFHKARHEIAGDIEDEDEDEDEASVYGHTRMLERRGSILEPAYESCSSPSEDEPSPPVIGVIDAGIDTGAVASGDAYGVPGAKISTDSDGSFGVVAIDVLSGSDFGVTTAVQAEVMKREAALESELREVEQTLDRDERKARLAERLARRKAGNADANDGDMQVRVLEATAKRARHLEVAKVMRTDFQQRASMEVAQARKRSVMQKRLMNRLVMRDVAASGTDSSSDAEWLSKQASYKDTSSLFPVAATVTHKVPRGVSHLQNIPSESEIDDTTLAIMKNVLRLMTKKDPVTVASVALRWLSMTKAGKMSCEKESALVASATLSVMDLSESDRESDLASEEESGQSVLDHDEPQLKRFILPAAAQEVAAPSIKGKAGCSVSPDDYAIPSISVKKGKGMLKSGVAFKPAVVKEVITKKKKKKKKKIKVKSRMRKKESEKGHSAIGAADVNDPVATPRRIKESFHLHLMFATSSDESS